MPLLSLSTKKITHWPTCFERASLPLLSDYPDCVLGMHRQLLANPSVLFCGYRLPHPLEPRFLLKIQTDGTVTAVQAIEQSCTLLIATLAKMKEKFGAEVRSAAIMGEEAFGMGGDVDY